MEIDPVLSYKYEPRRRMAHKCHARMKAILAKEMSFD